MEANLVHTRLIGKLKKFSGKEDNGPIFGMTGGAYCGTISE